jgi:TMEM175 potassium channel family protein
MTTSRLEAFSDGVIAIAITLLVLEIDVPSPESGGSLGHKLAEQWPSYAAYGVSFLTIGVIWINHHAMVNRLRTVDHAVLLLNLILLLFIGVLPWSTSLIADYLREGEGQHLAAAIYAGSFLAMSCAFYAMQRHILFSRTSNGR